MNTMTKQDRTKAMQDILEPIFEMTPEQCHEVRQAWDAERFFLWKEAQQTDQESTWRKGQDDALRTARAACQDDQEYKEFHAQAQQAVRRFWENQGIDALYTLDVIEYALLAVAAQDDLTGAEQYLLMAPWVRAFEH